MAGEKKHKVDQASENPLFDLSRRLALDDFVLGRLVGRVPTVRSEIHLPSAAFLKFHGKCWHKGGQHDLAAIIFARRTLEVAYGLAQTAQLLRTRDDDISDWEELGSATTDARRSLGIALRNMADGDFIHEDAPYHISQRLMQLDASFSNSEEMDEHFVVDASGRYPQFSDAETLVRAHSILSRIAPKSDVIGKSLRSTRTNPPDVIRWGFVTTMAEGWTYLFASSPGRQKIAAKNPFLRFLEDGWQDLSLPESQFGSFLDKLPQFSTDTAPEWL